MKKLYVFFISFFCFMMTACSESSTMEEAEDTTPDTEQLVEYITGISEEIDPLFMECETIEELATYLDKIKKIKGVADAWVTNTALYIETKGGFPLSWLYTPDINEENIEIRSTSVLGNDLYKSRSVAWDKHYMMEGFNKLCIIDQTYNDDRFNEKRTFFDFIENQYENAGFDVGRINGKDFNYNFIKDSLPEYNMIYMITHGFYDEKHNRHVFLSGTDVVIDKKNSEELRWMIKEKYLDKRVSVGYVKEIHGSDTLLVAYEAYSEDFIAGTTKKYDNSIIFWGACQSMKDNERLAESFLDKGAKVFIGYNESNCQAFHSGTLFWKYMLQYGCTNFEAFELLNKEDKHPNHPTAQLKIKYKNESDKNICIVHPCIETCDPTEIGSSSTTLNGKITGCSNIEFEFGFCYSRENKNPTVENGMKNDEVVNAMEDDCIIYSVVLSELEPETTYYFRTYMYINGQYIYGDVKTFTTTVGESASIAEAVDLGLSVKWASHNVGATKPEEYGGYYAWGEIEEKDVYALQNYEYVNSALRFEDIGENISGTKYDVAHVKWGNGWRMPTEAEVMELVSCRYERIDVNGVECLKFIGDNGNYIILPKAGGKSDKFVIGEDVMCWSSTVWSTDNECANLLYDTGVGVEMRYHGFPIRPVKD